MQTTRTSIQHVSEHLRHVEEILDPIRRDRSIDDAERRRMISDVLAAANARALSLHAARQHPAAPLAPSRVSVIQGRRWHRELAAAG